MSHTNHTQYYNLPQYAGSDIINPLVDTNGAYEAIDTAIHNIAAEAAQDTADVAILQNKVGSGVFDTTAQNATDAVNELVGELNTADTGVKARLTTAESDIDTLQSQMVTAQGNITDLQNNKANQSEVNAALALKANQSEVDTINAKISGISIIANFSLQAAKVTSDGAKTYAELLADLESAFASYISSLTAGYTVDILYLAIAGVGNFVPQAHQGNILNGTYSNFTTNGTRSLNYCIQRISSGWKISSDEIASDGTVTHTNLNDVVPSVDKDFIVQVRLYHTI